MLDVVCIFVSLCSPKINWQLVEEKNHTLHKYKDLNMCNDLDDKTMRLSEHLCVFLLSTLLFEEAGELERGLTL